MHNALSPDTKPWVDLGGNLGAVAAAMCPDQKQGIKVTHKVRLFYFFTGPAIIFVICFEIFCCLPTVLNTKLLSHSHNFLSAMGPQWPSD